MSIPLAEKARTVFEALVGRRSGIVRQVRAVPPIDGDARLEYVAKETGHVCVCTEAVVERAGLEKEAEHLGRFPIRGQGELPVYGLPLPERRSSAKVAT